MSLLQLLQRLDKTKFVPIVVFYHDNVFSERYAAEGIETISLYTGNDTTETPQNGLNLFYLRSLKYFLTAVVPTSLRLFRLIKHHRVMLVHQNHGVDRAAVIAAKLSGVRQVCHFRHFSNVSRSKSFLYRFIDCGIFNSQAVEQHYRNQRIHLKQGYVIYNPIEKNRCNKIESRRHISSEFGISESQLVLATVGRITPWKGQLICLRAFEKILGRFPNSTLLIVGSPGNRKEDRDYLRRLKSMSNKGVLRKHVIFTGQRQDIDRIMAAVDITIHSAVEPEPFGRVIVESMSANTPVIATNAGGVREIVKDGVNGLLVPPQDIAALSEAMLRLSESNTFATELAGAGYMTAEERFSVTNHVKQIEALYGGLLGIS